MTFKESEELELMRLINEVLYPSEEFTTDKVKRLWFLMDENFYKHLMGYETEKPLEKSKSIKPYYRKGERW